MRRWLEDWLALLLPAACARCETPIASEVLCEACAPCLPVLRVDGCLRCQRPTPRGAELCSACRGRRSPLRACLAEVPFEGEPADWIRRFKYPARGLAGLDPAPGALAERWILAAAARAAALGPCAAVVPIPLHPRRLRRRGFDPAALLARRVAKARSVPLQPLLARLRDTPSQTGLGRAARRRNVAGAFAARGSVAGERIWLVDDVVTTGATLEAAARALRRAGAREVIGLAAARTPGPD